jgi:hypothetical protein
MWKYTITKHLFHTQMSTTIITTNLWQNMLVSNPHRAQVYNKLKRLHKLNNKE